MQEAVLEGEAQGNQKPERKKIRLEPSKLVEKFMPLLH
jgi:hypothetical protein